MFIYVKYKDAPELSLFLRRSMSELDPATEKTLLVNPYCPVRIMLEYIRKKCKLGVIAQFDLCGKNGALKGLFNMPTYAYATDRFQHKKTYYVIVMKQEQDKQITVLPQLNHDNPQYEFLEGRVKRFLLTGAYSPSSTDATSSRSANKAPIKKKK